MKKNWLGIVFGALLMLVTLVLFSGMLIVGINWIATLIIIIVGVSSGILIKQSW